MPEGPEASFLADYMDTRFKNKYLSKFEIVKGRYVNHEPPVNTAVFVKQLPLKCLNVTKKGKVIYFYFANGWCLISKLGMSGWWYCEGDEPDWKPMSKNIVLEFDNKQLIFSDFRNYGTLTITRDPTVIQTELDKVAPDILASTTTLKTFKTRINQQILKPTLQQHLIEDVLVDQKVIMSGIGNYLKAEILYDTRISPLRMIKDITFDEWIKIFKSAKKLTKEMFAILQSKDKSSEKYMSSMKVYSRKQDPYGNPVHTRTTKTGRTTWWVPTIQK